MMTLMVISSVLLFLGLLGLSFVVLGALRAINLLRWKIEQLQIINPTRKGRSGLIVGQKAPDFKLPAVGGGEVTLATFVGRQVFLVFVQSGCTPCHSVVPELNRLHKTGKYEVLVINNGDPIGVQKWKEDTRAAFPVLIQDKWTVSKDYDILATPFAFLIDEQSVIAAKGIVSKKEYVSFVLERRPNDCLLDGDKTE